MYTGTNTKFGNLCVTTFPLHMYGATRAERHWQGFILRAVSKIELLFFHIHTSLRKIKKNEWFSQTRKEPMGSKNFRAAILADVHVPIASAI